MSGLTERIAAVLMEHHYAYTSVAWCTCGLNFKNGDEFYAHVAARVEESLGLTEEHGSTVNGIPFSIRYVSKWFRGPAWSEVES